MAKCQIFLILLLTVLWMCYLCAGAGKRTWCASGCKSSCPKNCNRTCDRNSGSCTQGCIPGRFGQKCKSHCSAECRNKECDSRTGKCLKGCKAGKYGDKCDLHCPEGCTNLRSCDQNNGTCSQGCKAGKYGDKCDLHCPVGCANLRSCDQNNGTCSQGCIEERYGEWCNKSCSRNCEGKRTCHRITGHCEEGCRSGHFGTMCEEKCPYNCDDDRKCNRTSGICTSGCLHNFYGDTCDRNCPPFCADGGKCNRSSGYCISGCLYKRWTETCEEECSHGCKVKCDMRNGSCPCRDGYYGTRCQYQCSSNCKQPSSCDKLTGYCACKESSLPGTCQDDLAFSKRARQSGTFKDLKTYPGAHTFEAELAVTGNTNCSRFYATSLTIEDKEPWWTVDLDGMYKVFRVDVTASRIEREYVDQYDVRLSNHSGPVNSSWAVCKTNISGAVSTSNCSDPSIAVATSVGIWRHNKSKTQLGLCKVNVYGNKVCKLGEYGSHCQFSCNGCVDHDCHELTGRCRRGCVKGESGPMCNKNCTSRDGSCGGAPCSENCRGPCHSNGNCTECRDGYHGNKCQHKCHANCFRKCRQTNGACYNCTMNFYGAQCNVSCPKNCEAGCSEYDGHCSGCKENFEGKICTDCVPGMYGGLCDQACPKRCKDKCDKKIGRCFDCKPGFHGDMCEKSCGKGCDGNGSCNQENGTCSCKAGYKPTLCTDCADERYGPTCNNICSRNCSAGCDKDSGKCLACPRDRYGEDCDKICWPGCEKSSCLNDNTCKCKEHLQGDRCEVQGLTGQQANTAVLVAVPVICVIIISVLAVLLIVWFRRGRPRFWKKGDPGNPFLENHMNAAFEVNGDTVDAIPSYQNLSSCIAVAAFPKHVEALTKTMYGFDQDFKDIPANPIHSWDVGVLPKNFRKNRFTNVIAYDHSRVKLATNGDDDYVNASYMNTPEAPKKFIAAQGPKPESVDDFVLMLFEQGVPLVVMVTNLKENKKSKCERYWPTDEGEEEIFGEVNVKMTSETKMPHYISRQLILEKDEKTHELTQLQYISWPDHGVPTNAASFLNFHEEAAKLYAFDKGPTVVHCSAGVGRTGTFLAMDYLLQQADEEGKIDIPKYINEMRDKRVLMVQSLSQYVFIHECLLEALHCGKTVYPVDTFNAEELLSSQDLATQYEMLDIMKIPVWPNDVENGSILNKHKDREGTPVPRDSRRPDLVTVVKGHDEYINAVLVQGYSEDDKVLVTQSPIENTVVDFWRLVYDCECGVILALNETDIDDYPGYLPEEEQVYGCFEVTPLSCEKTGNYIKRKLMLKRKEEELVVYHIRPQTMPTPQELPEIPTMLSVLEEINNLKRDADENGLLIHCQQGVEFSGLFCVLGIVIEQINHEQEVGVFHAVKQARLSRPQFITSMDQYKWLHQAAGAYIETLTTYANFQTPESPEK